MSDPQSGPPWPTHEVLEQLAAWDPPAPSEDLEDRIVNAWQREMDGPLALSGHVPVAATTTRRLSHRAVGIAVVSAAMAVAAMLLLWLARPAAPPPAAEPSVSSPATVPAPRPTLTFTVVPPDAQVFVDEVLIGDASPYVLPAVDPGKYTLRVARPGFLPQTRTVEVIEGGLVVPITLQRAVVHLSVITEPAAATVALIGTDGSNVPVASGRHRIDRVPGVRYEVVAQAAGYETARAEVVFDGTDAQRVQLLLPRSDGAEPTADTDLAKTLRGIERNDTLKSLVRHAADAEAARRTKRASPKTGTLRVGTRAGIAPASVFVDGKPKGKTPLTAVRLAPGRHRVELRWPGGDRYVRNVVVEANRSVVVRGDPDGLK